MTIIKRFTLVLTLVLLFGGMTFAAEEVAKQAGSAITPTEQNRLTMIKQATDYLQTVQEESGGFSTKMGIGPSTIVLLGLIGCDLPEDHPLIQRGFTYLLAAVHDDGGIYSPGERIATYESCLAMSCLNLAKKKYQTNRFDSLLQKGEAFVRRLQYYEETGTTRDDASYGGTGYGKKSRPDLSNTQFFVETLHELGAPSDDPAIQRALLFVTRCQNLESVERPTALGPTSSDGGFIYTCFGDGESFAEQETNGGLRSYGSMTYAGLKSMIYAGLTKDDPRVASALGWLKKHYSLTENPGLEQRGLYYYYQTVAKTFDALGQSVFVDDEGKSHFWKNELIEALRAAQQLDGSWVNENPMWREDDPVLVTGYALIVLSFCK